MDHAEMVALIRAGIDTTTHTWADLGAGTGNFTRALATCLGPGSTIFAVDYDPDAIARLSQVRADKNLTTFHTIVGDFTGPLDLPQLDGILMANSFHWVRNQVAVLAHVANFLRPGGRIILVEYDVHRPMLWVPAPMPFERFAELAPTVGLTTPERIGTRRSPSSGTEMYAAVTYRPGAPTVADDQDMSR